MTNVLQVLDPFSFTSQKSILSQKKEEKLAFTNVTFDPIGRGGNQNIFGRKFTEKWKGSTDPIIFSFNAAL